MRRLCVLKDFIRKPETYLKNRLAKLLISMTKLQSEQVDNMFIIEQGNKFSGHNP